MRIIHVVPDFSLGGISKGGCVLAGAMARAGHEVSVIGLSGGPRFQSDPTNGEIHIRASSDSTTELAREIVGHHPDIVHIHGHGFWLELIDNLSASPEAPLVVSTPTFARLPDDLGILDRTCVCLVGVYTFYRFCHWLRVPYGTAVKDRRIGYVPITPFQPSDKPVSTIDEPSSVAERRLELGVPENGFVVGRIGRDDADKWRKETPRLVSSILSHDPRICWLSIGMPDSLGPAELEARWGNRFRNLPETPDYQLLMQVLSSMDVQIFFGHGECFASSIVEAAGAGVPTIAMANPLRDNGQAEQVIDGRTGYLVRSIKDALPAVVSLLEDPAQLRQMKESAFRHCMDRWHVERSARDLVALYQYWLGVDDKAAPPQYVELMIAESKDFARSYKSRLIQLMGTNIGSRVVWLLLLRAVADNRIWRAGRALKRFYVQAVGRG